MYYPVKMPGPEKGRRKIRRPFQHSAAHAAHPIARNTPKRILAGILLLLFVVFTAIIILSYKSESPAMVTGAQAAGNRQPVLIIDAGHGGLDGGASSADGRIESAINLQIAQDLEFLARLFGEKTVMTRTENELHYPDDAMTVKEKKLWDQNTRIALINSVEQGVLISIHQNKFPDTRPHGTQVLFAPTDGSMEFGKLTHDMLITTLNPENRRVASPISEKIYLMKNINCPAILVECGFLSNLTEVERLSDATYQFQIAAVLFASYLQYTSV